MNIKILGTGCPKCKTLENVTLEALQELDVNASVEKVEDIMKILSYNVLHTPALVMNEKIVISGQVPGVNQVKELILKNQ